MVVFHWTYGRSIVMVTYDTTTTITTATATTTITTAIIIITGATSDNKIKFTCNSEPNLA